MGKSATSDFFAGNTIKIVLLALTATWQVYTMGRLGAFGSHLLESRDRHEELQRSLHDAQAALQNLHNASRSCEHMAHDHAAQLESAARERKALEFKLEELTELNGWLNQSAAAKEGSLRAEQVKRLTLEGSVSSLKEQMNLMQGQLVTAQQQQGTLHKRGKHKQ